MYSAEKAMGRWEQEPEKASVTRPAAEPNRGSLLPSHRSSARQAAGCRTGLHKPSLAQPGDELSGMTLRCDKDLDWYVTRAFERGWVLQLPSRERGRGSRAGCTSR